MDSKSVVSIAKCDGYEDIEHVKSSIRQALGDMGSVDGLLSGGKRVLLKPNLLDYSRKPEAAVNTHPSVLKALSIVLKEDYGCKVLIGDSSGGVYGKTHLAFENMGFTQIAEEVGVELVNFDRAEQLEVSNPDNNILKEFTTSKVVRDVDCIINVPKLKTHDLVDFTGSVKNMFGVISGSGKRDIHVKAPRAEQLAECVADIYQTVKPDLCIMDAVVGMEGPGPAAGNPKKIGLILASRDGVALDAIATKIVGFDPLKIIISKVCHNRGIGTADIDSIEVKGESITDVLVRDFKKTVKYNYSRISFVPDFLIKQLWRGQTEGHPVIKHSKCVHCKLCMESCPVNAISDSKRKFKIDLKKCIECYCCSELCPENAIYVKIPFTVRAVNFCIHLASKMLSLIRR